MPTATAEIQPDGSLTIELNYPPSEVEGILAEIAAKFEPQAPPAASEPPSAPAAPGQAPAAPTEPVAPVTPVDSPTEPQGASAGLPNPDA